MFKFLDNIEKKLIIKELLIKVNESLLKCFCSVLILNLNSSFQGLECQGLVI